MWEALEAALQKLHWFDMSSLNAEQLKLAANVLPNSSVTRLTRDISMQTPGAIEVISQILEDSQNRISEFYLAMSILIWDLLWPQVIAHFGLFCSQDSQTKIEELDLGVQGDLLASEVLALLTALPRSKLTTLAMPRVPWNFQLASAFRKALSSPSSHVRCLSLRESVILGIVIIVEYYVFIYCWYYSCCFFLILYTHIYTHIYINIYIYIYMYMYIYIYI